MTQNTESDASNSSDFFVAESSPLDLNLPVPSVPLAPSHRIGSISWADYMDEIEGQLQRYLRDHDRPEDRLARKIPERFVLDL